jgi:hypothetical protein
MGLGMTQVFDAFGVIAAREATDGLVAVITKGSSLLVSLAAAGFFLFVGARARDLRTWPYVLGMGVYALDALIFLLLQDWIAIGFHVFVLFNLWRGLGTTRAIRQAEACLGQRSASPTLPL